MSTDRTALDDDLRAASNRVLVDAILPAMRLAARRCGYAIAVHGSLCRDVDLVAVPWIEHGVASADDLVGALVGAIGGVASSCHPAGDWTNKPHGRRAKILHVFAGGISTALDLSVMPVVGEAQGATP